MTGASRSRLSGTGTVEVAALGPSVTNVSCAFGLGHPGLVCVGSSSVDGYAGLVAAVTDASATLVESSTVDHGVLRSAIAAAGGTTAGHDLMVVVVLEDDDGTERTLARSGTGGAVATVNEDGVWTWLESPVNGPTPQPFSATFSSLEVGSRVVVLAGTAAQHPTISHRLLDADLLTAEALATALERSRGMRGGAYVAVLDPWGRPPGTPAPRVEGEVRRRSTRWWWGRRGALHPAAQRGQAGSIERTNRGVN